MSGKSSKSTVVPIRLPNEVVAKIKRRIAPTPQTVSGYIRNRIIYDVSRKHGKGKKK